MTDTTDLPGGQNFDEPPLPEPTGLPPRDSEVGGDELSFDRPRRAGVTETMRQAAEGRVVEDVVATDARRAMEFIERVRGTHPRGYLEVKRTGPLGALAPTEYGTIGKVPFAKLRGRAIDDVIRAAWGGGEFEVVARDSMHGVIPGGSFEVEIAGSPIPVSEEGVEHAERRRERRVGGNVRDRIAEEVASRPAGQGGDNAFLVLMLQQLQADREERAEERKRIDEEAKERREREDRDRREREKREAEERDRRDREWRKEVEDRSARQAAELQRLGEEARARHERQLAEDSRRHDMTMKAWEADREREREAIERREKHDLGLGVLRRVREELAEAVSDGLLGGTGKGGGGEDDGGLGGAFKDMIRKDGGAILGRFLDIFASAKGLPVPNPTAPVTPPAASIATEDPDVDTVPVLPPPAQVAQAATGAVVPVAAPAADAAAAPTAREALANSISIASRKAAARPVLFLRCLSSEIVAQSDPEAAWDLDQDDAGTTLSGLFYALPAPLRAAFRQGWKVFADVAGKNIPATRGDLDAISAVLMREPSAKPWIKAFREAAPPETVAVAPGAPHAGPPNPVGGPMPEASAAGGAAVTDDGPAGDAAGDVGG